jgi:hypothetical protein
MSRKINFKAVPSWTGTLNGTEEVILNPVVNNTEYKILLSQLLTYINDNIDAVVPSVDLNGSTSGIILDADADTSISAPTDDQIDFEIAGADDFTMTANTFTALSGSTIATNTIAETTAASGVTIDGVLVKDSSVALADGLVSNLAVKIGADTNNGLYGVSDTQLGIAVEGVLVAGANTAGLFTDVIAEQTSTVGVTVDGVLLKDAGVSANSMFAGFYPVVAQNNITANTGGAIAVTNYLTTINTDADADAYTLANGAQIGQLKKILLVTDGGGDGVVTPATAFAGGTTATFNDAGDYLVLLWSGAAWVVLENSGVTIA